MAGFEQAFGEKDQKGNKVRVPVINDEGSMASCFREKRMSFALDVLCLRHSDSSCGKLCDDDQWGQGSVWVSKRSTRGQN